MPSSEKQQKKEIRRSKKNRFTDSLASVSDESILVMFVIGDEKKQEKNFFQTDAQQYQVTDQMTIAQLRLKWYKDNKLSKELSHPPEEYIFMWDLSYALQNEYTISKIKQMVGLTRFNDRSILKVCWEWCCHLKADQAALDYGTFIQKNQNKYDITFKILTNEYLDTCYFYLPCRLDATLQTVKQDIAKYFQSNYQKKQIKYRLWMQNDSATNQFKSLKQTDDAIKNSLIKEEGKCISDFTDCEFDKENNKLLMVRILAAGHTVQIRFNEALGLPVNTIQNNNPDIKITYFQRENKKNSNSVIKKEERTHKFTEIQGVRVETLLFEQGIEDAHFTSLYFGSHVLRPEQKFQKLASFLNFQKANAIQLVSIPQNLLYYKQIVELQKSQKKVIDLKQIFDVIAGQAKQLGSDDKKYQLKQPLKLKDLVLKHLDDLTDQIFKNIEKKQYQNKEFLLPIVLYTSNYMYQELNKYLRVNSISRILNAILDEKAWHYPFCQKFIQSLLSLHNFQGKVYRISVETSYNYKVGEIKEWNGFISTSKQKNQAGKFVSNGEQKKTQILYLFQIETYSGRQIKQFSAHPNEDEVILFPYTRFKVISVQQDCDYNIKNINQKGTFVKLLEIPIPKRIPGNIVVWIDSNIKQNFQTFQQIVKYNKLEDFDLIQLVDNAHFKVWLQQYRQALSLKEIKVHFISNMNRPPEFKQQGIQTLQIIRSFRQTALVVYYIGDLQKAWSSLKSKGKENDPNLEVCNTVPALSKIFAQILHKN